MPLVHDRHPPHVPFMSSFPLSGIAFPQALPLPAQRIARLRRLAWLLDAALVIPGTRIRFGIDAVVGLLPGGGPLLMAAISLFFVWEAWRMQVPRAILLRMLLNIGLEALFDCVPVLGDLADVAFKANLRNISILEQYFEKDRRFR